MISPNPSQSTERNPIIGVLCGGDPDARARQLAKGMRRAVREWLDSYLRASDSGRETGVPLPVAARVPGCEVHSRQLVELVSGLAHLGRATMLELRDRVAPEHTALAEQAEAIEDALAEAAADRTSWTRADVSLQTAAEGAARRERGRLGHRMACYAVLGIAAFLADTAIMFCAMRSMFAVGDDFVSDWLTPAGITLMLSLGTAWCFDMALSPTLLGAVQRRMPVQSSLLLAVAGVTARVVLAAFGLALPILSVLVRSAVLNEQIAGFSAMMVAILVGSSLVVVWATTRWRSLRTEAHAADETAAIARENQQHGQKRSSGGERDEKRLRAKQARIVRKLTGITDRLVKRTVVQLSGNTTATVLAMAKVHLEHESRHGCGGGVAA